MNIITRAREIVIDAILIRELRAKDGYAILKNHQAVKRLTGREKRHGQYAARINLKRPNVYKSSHWSDSYFDVHGHDAGFVLHEISSESLAKVEASREAITTKEREIRKLQDEIEKDRTTHRELLSKIFEESRALSWEEVTNLPIDPPFEPKQS
jgi:hypothetical protein